MPSIALGRLAYAAAWNGRRHREFDGFLNYVETAWGILVPTLVLHRTEDLTVSIQAGRFLAAHILHAKLVELDGPDHIYWLGDNAVQIADLVVNFITQPGTDTHSTAESRRMLATILFTDIVDSTLQAREMGDHSSAASGKVRPSFTACASCSSRMRSSGIRCVIVSAVLQTVFRYLLRDRLR